MINRVWAMPNKNTFSIKPINDLVKRYALNGLIILDPFVGESPFKSICYSNDLNNDIVADCHYNALEFLTYEADSSADLLLFDPPYSPRQVSECYKKLGKTVNMETTQASFWSKFKKEISRVVKKDGHVITCGWNSGGIGKSNGFEIIEILLVPHGGWHNDTIVVVEKRL